MIRSREKHVTQPTGRKWGWTWGEINKDVQWTCHLELRLNYKILVKAEAPARGKCTTREQAVTARWKLKAHTSCHWPFDFFYVTERSSCQLKNPTHTQETILPLQCHLSRLHDIIISTNACFASRKHTQPTAFITTLNWIYFDFWWFRCLHHSWMLMS